MKIGFRAEINMPDLQIVINDHDSKQPFPLLFSQLKAIKELIENLDFKLEMDEDFDIVQKSYISILSSIGNLLKTWVPNQETKHPLEVTKFILDFILEEKLHEHDEYVDYAK